MALTPGTRVGPYQVVSAVGAGGMGEVYRATDTKLKRLVAIKILPPSLRADRDRLARLQREAEVLASLNHPNIAAIYGLEESGDMTALVMELVEGDDLSTLIARGPVSRSEALPIARQIAEALDTAHERGIVHRDLKPANVKVRADGTVKVLDFGLAKATEPAGASSGNASALANSPTATSPAMTLMGTILGTAAYMSPEQARGRSVDRRADIWAFGVVVFEMLAGRRLFQGEDLSDILAAVLRQEIDWTLLPADTPPTVLRLLRRCLERDIRHRLRDIGDALPELTSSTEPSSIGDRRAVPTQRPGVARWLPWSITAMALSAAGVAAGWAFTRPAAVSGAVVRARNVVQGVVGFLAVSRDGYALAYTSFGADGVSLALRRTDELDAHPIPGSETGMLPVFSPDGQWIAYTSFGQPFRIRKIPVAGGTSIALCEGSFAGGAAWGDDGYLVFSGERGLMRVSASGGTPETVTTVDGSKGEVAHVSPQFLPGGRQLLFTVVTGKGADFAVLDFRQGKYRTIAKGGASGRYVGGGYLTYVRDSTLFAAPFDATRLATTGPEVPVETRVSMSEYRSIGDYSVSDTGLLTYARVDDGTSGTTLAWAEGNGQTALLPGESRQGWGRGRLSPDGRQVANAILGDNGTDIWVMDAVRGTLTRLTSDGGNADPIWTPDGRGIVYWSHETLPGRSGLYRVAADDSGRPDEIFATTAQVTPTSISPDGETLLAYRPNDQGQNQILVLPLQAGPNPREPRPLHDASASEADGEVSPNGRWVAYESTESGDVNVYLQPFPGPGGRIRVSPESGNAPRWARDGRALYYWRGAQIGLSGTLMRVRMSADMPLQLGKSEALFQLPHGTTWDVAPDHNRFLVELPGDGSLKGITSTFITVTNWFDELRRRVPAGK